jgi:hypothetical protein
MKGSAVNKLAPPPGNKWAPGAEPLALCMSCSSTYPQEETECPNCQVSLSVVRKCPSCGRVQAAQHIACIYCADSFIREEGLAPLQSGPVTRRRKEAEQKLRLIAGVTLAVVVAAGAALFLTRHTWREAPRTIGQTYVLASTSMRAEAATNSPPVKDLQPSEIVSITDYAIDAMGNRWFRVSAADVNGFVLTQEVAPPKGKDSEKGFEILRHSLLGLEDPDVLSDANRAVEYYRNSFPASPHLEELRWLLAERTREIAEHSGRPRALLASAREHYQEVVRTGGEYAERAQQALEDLSEGVARSGASERTSSPPEGGYNFVGGSAGASPGAGPASATGPVRRVAVVSKTTLWVRLTQDVDVVPGASFPGLFAQDIRVNKEIAIPRGSPVTMKLASGANPDILGGLQMTAATIAGENYPVSATAVRIVMPGNSTRTSQALAPVLPAGTRLGFQLDTPLIVRQR